FNLRKNMPNQVPEREKPILEALIERRDRLIVLKKDRSRSIRASDVTDIFDEVIELISHLNTVREEYLTVDSQSQVDDTLDDVFQLLSLFFMALGKTKDSAASYVQLATIKQCLDHLNESGAYTLAELMPYENRIKDLHAIINDKNNPVPEPYMKLLQHKLLSCETVLQVLMDSVHTISPDLLPIYEQLVKIKEHLISILSSSISSVPLSSITPVQKELHSIDSLRVDGRFLSPDGSIPPGQAHVVGLLEECYEDIHELLVAHDEVAESLKPTRDILANLKEQLEGLILTHRWTMREPDLWSYQMQLNEIDGMRVNGQFYDDQGNVASGQKVLLYLLHRCYRLVYKILSASESISEFLMPIHNQLHTVRKCLLEVKKWGGPFTARELYPFQMKLASIDNLRVEGKFLDEYGTVPHGQGLVMLLLSECYDLLYELKADIIEEEEK
ncbi:1382_t:CDS:2, partial [Paraglomus brasilianum]